MSRPPIFLNLLKIQLPVAALSSILHRLSAVGIFLLFLPFTFILVLALNSEDGFNKATFFLDLFLVKTFLSLLLIGLIYHFMSGIRHLIMDFGYWSTLRSGKYSAIGTIFLSILFSLILIIQIW